MWERINIKHIAELIGRYVSTIHYIIKKSKPEETIANKHHIGRSKN